MDALLYEANRIDPDLLKDLLVKSIPAGWAAGADDRATSELFARRHFAVDLDQFNEAFDAEVGEGHDALVSKPLDPDHAVLRLHFDGDVEEEVDVFDEILCDDVYGPDVGDLVDVMVQAASAATASGRGSQFHGNNS